MPSAPRVLVVDDDPDQQELLGAILSSSGYEVEHAVTGRDALERALLRVPALIIADWRLPDLPHGEVVRQMLDEDRLRGVPLVVCTADQRAEHDHDPRHLGVRTWLLKPCTPTSILAVVREIVPIGP
jgi:CheY-like chemotaxis protein